MLDLQSNAGGPTADALTDLGLSFKDLEGLTTTDQLGLIGERLQEVGNEGERSALSAKIFGEEAGPGLATLLAEGQAGLAALGDQAKNVMTPEDLQRAAEFQDAMTNISSVFEGIAQQIAVDLIPPILEIVQGFQSWIENNQEFIDLGLDVVLTLLADIFNAVQREVQLLVAIFKPLITFVASLIKRVDKATGIFKLFRRIITAIFNPMRTLIDIVETLILGLEKLGIVSEGSAARFGSAVDKMVADSAGFDLIGQRADDMGSAVADANAETENAKDEFGNPISIGKGTSPEQAQRNIEREKRRQARAARRGKSLAGGGGGGGGRDKPKDDKPDVLSAVSLDEIFERAARGDLEAFSEDLGRIEARTPDVRDVKPTVAISIFNVKFEAGAIQVTGPSPVETAQEVAAAFSRELRRTAESMANIRKR